MVMDLRGVDSLWLPLLAHEWTNPKDLDPSEKLSQIQTIENLVQKHGQFQGLI